MYRHQTKQVLVVGTTVVLCGVTPLLTLTEDVYSVRVAVGADATRLRTIVSTI